ncbi:MAG: hypothetical protein WAM75_14820, partial [Xanthobacteraceae bacterium]
HEVLRAGGERVAFVAPDDVEGWIAAIARALQPVPAERGAGDFARALCAKYSSQRMIESYLSLFEVHRRHQRVELQELAPAAEKVQP